MITWSLEVCNDWYYVYPKIVHLFIILVFHDIFLICSTYTYLSFFLYIYLNLTTTPSLDIHNINHCILPETVAGVFCSVCSGSSVSLLGFRTYRETFSSEGFRPSSRINRFRSSPLTSADPINVKKIKIIIYIYKFMKNCNFKRKLQTKNRGQKNEIKNKQAIDKTKVEATQQILYLFSCVCISHGYVS